MKIAVVKPDHIGDFILTIPSFNAIYDLLGPYELFIGTRNKFLYDYFLSDKSIGYNSLDLDYLSKGQEGISIDECILMFKDYDYIIILRNDFFMQYLNRVYAFNSIIVEDSFLHETIKQKNLLIPLLGNYDHHCYFNKKTIEWPNEIKTIGFCISAGFISNKLPMKFIIEFIHFLLSNDKKVILIGGPSELKDIEFIIKFFGREFDSIIGSIDLEFFYLELDKVDLVVGSDSGTLHLCSYSKPILGLFTSSPWQIYSPYGKSVKILTSDLLCSPCIQYSKSHFNACIFKRCSLYFTPKLVYKAMLQDNDKVGYISRISFDGSEMTIINSPSFIEN